MVGDWHSQFTREVLQNSGLQMNDLGSFALVHRTPDLGVTGDVDQIDLYSQPVVSLRHACGHDCRDAQFPTGILRPYRHSLEMKGARPRCDTQAPQLYEAIDRGFRQSIGQIAVVRTVGNERQDGNRVERDISALGRPAPKNNCADNDAYEGCDEQCAAASRDLEAAPSGACRRCQFRARRGLDRFACGIIVEGPGQCCVTRHDRRNKAITARRHRLDHSVPIASLVQGLPQGGDVHAQVHFFDECVGPYLA